ncbi:putative bifunctional diguanylate cyclase/phosphodiesterase [Ovoidimarina sediminis]|uniref:putative bifunctional diguanylate cyclase/phosphodiesterase n=1 Tax=Ovoidimarina sediminis TaxID=3079856 RepID=UPI00290FD8F3|nr:bifunctional diguanylate cyclase/phosphodiesterase [Rhodophyticola sp. MJ-SS7]MDU8943418.1 bifunctional diguanylate cyclase/phosphodiesterase [Rhodophyticola sp. MJ-SS7]
MTGQLKALLDRALDVMSTRIGVAVSLAPLIVLCLWAGIYIQQGLEDLEEKKRLFADRQFRNGFAAMSDVQRLNLVAMEAAQAGQMTAELQQAFRNATDFLYVRVGTLERSGGGVDRLPEGQQAIADLSRVLGIAERALEAGVDDPQRLTNELLDASDASRRSLATFVDYMRGLQDGVLDAQSGVIRDQLRVMWVSLILLTLVGIITILLLRREVLARRGRGDAERRVEYLAFFDPLTGLPNRVQFHDRLTALIETGRPVAVMILDLDGFKSINDTSGHAAGDAVLRAAAHAIDEAVGRQNGFAARLAGDEFAAVVATDDIERLNVLCGRILTKVAEPVCHEGEALSAGISIGLATSTQVSSKMDVSVETMLRATDLALYAAKAAGRNRVAVYDEELERQYQARRALIESLPEALRRGELSVYLQPKVRLPSREIYGFEALVRWDRDGRTVMPDEFIMIAEESGMVTEVDTFVLVEAASAIAAWNARHGTSFHLSVNLSALNFTSQGMVETVRTAITKSKIDPALMTLEITETLELRDWPTAQSTIRRLRAMGCRIAIDDFGTGYSSLAYLRLVGADELKVDRSLISEVAVSDEARFIVDAVLDVGRNIGMEVLVEGVETEEQAGVLEDMGVRLAQGFLFGTPLPAEAALADAMRARADAPGGLAG